MFGAMALWLIPQVDDPDALLWVGFLLLATGFSVAGGFILFASFETEVDRAAGSVSDVTRLFRFIWYKRREIGDASRVELRAEDRMNTSADDFDSRTYRVWLRGPGNDDPGIPVISEIKYPAARAHAVATAEYLALPLEDYTAAEPRGDAERPISPARKPPGTRFLREEESDSATLRLATPGFRGVHCFYLSVAFAFPLGVHFFAASSNHCRITGQNGSANST